MICFAFPLAVTTITLTVATSEVKVIYPIEYQEACKQPIAIGTTLTSLIILPFNMLGMFLTFTHIEKTFNPSRTQARLRMKDFSRRAH